MSERIGERYELRSELARGAMGAVYTGHDSESGDDVALKRLLDPRHAVRFEIEARLLMQFSHPRVVRVRDYLVEDDGSWLVMDLVEGRNLHQLLNDKGEPGLPLDEAVGYVLEAAEALAYVHAQNTVHRDVKPLNLMLCDEGIVLVDFGIARDLLGSGAGTVGIGTPGFMAPELYGEGTLSRRTDVYGLAATFWTLLTGKPPIPGKQVKLKGAPPEVERALAEGLEPDAERRLGSVEAFAELLGGHAAADRGATLSASVEEASAPRNLLEAVVRTAAGMFDAAATSVALAEPDGELVYQAVWGAGADAVLGMRLPRGRGIAGAVLAACEGRAIPDCRADTHFEAQVAERTGYVPYTMLVVPLKRAGRAIGVLSLLDRRDGEPYTADDIERADLFAELAVGILDSDPRLEAAATDPA
jgi:hypothetical protein